MALQSSNRRLSHAKESRRSGIVLTLGYFGYETNQLDGQTIKTRTLYELIDKKLPNTFYFDTQRLQRNRWALFSLLGLLLRARKVIFLPSYRSLAKLLLPLFVLSRICRFEIYYFVVGGGLVKFVAKRPLHRFILSKIKAILSETEAMTHQLTRNYGFKNTAVLYNFRPRSEVRTNKCPKVNEQDIKLVFMSRINKMKGIETLFELAKVLEDHGNVVIDVYGPVLEEDRSFFFDTLQKHRNIAYRGVLEPSEISATLSRYDVLLFPTKYYNEGLPGALIDAYFAGLTVVATDWRHAPEFIRHDETGLICEWDNAQDFIGKVVELVENPAAIERLKANAANEVEKYTSEAAWTKISSSLS